ncbi:GH25 family lysozyme [Haloferula sargassicola]|uniref:Lysozyme n=1 Tax=Haloferula sargassicola TaxID=490096 RepID=A0ABP9UTC9_9BACT
MKWLTLLAIVPFLTQCGGFGGTSVSDSPAVLNVSSWDPKEIQRGGDRYSRHDVSAMRRNGALALIARSAKGPALDDKFADFAKSADRAGMMVGAYHFVTTGGSAAAQADAFIDRVKSVARSRGLSHRRILLVGDFDTHSTPDRLVSFIERVEQRTGVTPVIYLENSDGFRARMRAASPAQKRVIRRAPYWLALYGPGGTERAIGGGGLTPDSLCEMYGCWSDWKMWQYGGVTWENGGSRAKHYNTSAWRSPRYFGNMAHPMERSVFRGSPEELAEFWNQHGLAWW